MALKRKQFVQRRKALGYTQESLAEELGVDRTTVVRWERGDSEPQPWIRKRLAIALDVSLDELDVLISEIVATTLDNSPPVGVTVAKGIDERGDTTDRRTFAISAALTALGVVGPARDVFASAEVPRTIGLEQVKLAASLVDRLRLADAAVGANELCDLAMGVHQRLSTLATHSSYGREVGEALQATLADLANEIGWLTIDAERRAESRRYLHEAISRARIIDDPRKEARALACLALFTREKQPKESLQCVEAAQRVSAGWATPRLRALLHLRAAHAYAHQQDADAFGREVSKALTHLDRGTHEDDLPVLAFVTEREARASQGLAYLALGRPDRAAAMFRANTAASPTPGHERNDVADRVLLAEAVRRQHDAGQAAEIALAVLPSVAALQSRRTAAWLAEVRAGIGRERSRSPKVRAFVEAYDQTTAG
ncbi:helix-turn-helix transcriptional regulator [Plantactinospora alkalitolerans]|uniref:helix-turn-helix transcriptional regulator n=1 Tax=Plantactinospora alkalitolerans TaxID=2789879 RepID=UPI002B1F4D91|nr:helix-turn-helix transcriptional regulator [Plantactinospora alkalitolerans]